MDKEIKITLAQLEELLIEQKRLTVERCMGHSYYYNLENQSGSIKELPIDKEKFKEQGMTARFPDDFLVLKKYII